MLVLSRKVGERIRVGNNIYVTVVRCQDGKVRLGFEAPKEIPIVRAEIDTEPVASGICPMPGETCCPMKQCRLENQRSQNKAS